MLNSYVKSWIVSKLPRIVRDISPNDAGPHKIVLRRSKNELTLR